MLFIIWVILMLILLVLTVVYFFIKGKEISILKYPSDWCYADWICGKDNPTSPVLKLIPILYACRIDNFTQEDGKDCVCPIQYFEDYKLDGDKLVKVNNPVGKLYFCDKSFYKTFSFEKGKVEGDDETLGRCKWETCERILNGRGQNTNDNKYKKALTYRASKLIEQT